MSEEFQELKERLVKLSDDQLIEIVLAPPGEYRKDALDIATAELKWRGVSIPEAEEPGEAEETKDTPSDTRAIDPLRRLGNIREVIPPNACPMCGGSLRPATLVAEKELTVVFSDNQEERFVKVNVCRQCGQVSLAADFETDVQQ